MSTTHSPRCASWLVRRFASGPNRESLVGDLDEQFARGRSSSWYWRQVAMAILAWVVQDLHEHQLLAMRSVVLTSALVVAWVEITLAAYVWVSERWVNALMPSSGIFFELWHPFGGGLCLIWCAGSAVSGWLSARRSGDHQTAMVVASALAQVPWSLWWSRSLWLHADRVAGSSVRLWLPYYISGIVVLVGMQTCVIVGGLWRADSDHRLGRVPTASGTDAALGAS